MANALEWYAMDPRRYGEPSGSHVGWGFKPTVIFYARVVGYPGPVVWTAIWEPMSSGPAPRTWAGGPVSVGQYPTEYNYKSPEVYVPQNSDACAICVGVLRKGNSSWRSGIVRLSAVAGGVPVPGGLVMTIVENDDGPYPDFALGYEYDYTPPTKLFWTQHNNTYEIP